MTTQLLEKAFAEASKLSAEEQDVFAAWILEELASERRWDKALSASGDVLDALGEEALEEHREGRSERLDADSL